MMVMCACLSRIGNIMITVGQVPVDSSALVAALGTPADATRIINAYLKMVYRCHSSQLQTADMCHVLNVITLSCVLLRNDSSCFRRVLRKGRPTSSYLSRMLTSTLIMLY